MGTSVSATVAVIATMNAQVAELAQELELHFEQHPDAEVVRSLPGLASKIRPAPDPAVSASA